MITDMDLIFGEVIFTKMPLEKGPAVKQSRAAIYLALLVGLRTTPCFELMAL